ncbi:MAG: outer membrane lipoprotein-sorting protein [candidate division FCPU426 bacterium]
MHSVRLGLIGLACLLLAAPLALAAEETLTGGQILSKVDDVFMAPKDKTVTTTMVLRDKQGNEKTRTLRLEEKGQDKRLTKFLTPKDQKGIAFLSLPGERMYLYLPAFKKTRRIASHVKNQRFAGTDFSYEDMEPKRYSEKWNAQRLPDEGDAYVLELALKPGQTSEYSRIKMWVGQDNFYTRRSEYYDQSQQLYKVMTLSDIRQQGGYWEAFEKTMQDVRTQHESRMKTDEIKFDTGIPDSHFTEQYLTQ